MKRTLLFVTVIVLTASAHAQNVLTRQEIYRINCKSVVQIYVNEHFSGVGFIVSQDGLIVTANHVIATRESNLREYATDIKVAVFGKPAPYPATPVTAKISDDQANYDSTVIKIEAANLPTVTLGDWSEVEVGDFFTITPSFPGIGCILLGGTFAAKEAAMTDFGPKPVNTILFESPVRNGFSGSPMFSPKGHVIGIVDTKVFGISPALAELRKELTAPGHADIQLNGGFGSLSATLTTLIDNLDQNLISGLGSGVDISYAEKQQEDARQHTH